MKTKTTYDCESCKVFDMSRHDAIDHLVAIHKVKNFTAKKELVMHVRRSRGSTSVYNLTFDGGIVLVERNE